MSIKQTNKEVDESRVAGTTQESISERTKQNVSDEIIAVSNASVHTDKELKANNTALKILQDYNLTLNPKIVYQLSKHILQNIQRNI